MGLLDIVFYMMLMPADLKYHWSPLVRVGIFEDLIILYYWMAQERLQNQFFFFLTGQEYMVRIWKFLNKEFPDMERVLLHNKDQMKLLDLSSFAKINQKQYLIPRECATSNT